MRNGSHRFGLGIAAAAAVTVIAVPAASANVVKYDTELTINKEAAWLYHGYVKSELGKCRHGRRVTLFKVRPGADRQLGTVLSSRGDDHHTGGGWAFRALGLREGDRAYAQVTRKERSRFVCLADRSRTLSF